VFSILCTYITHCSTIQCTYTYIQSVSVNGVVCVRCYCRYYSAYWSHCSTVVLLPISFNRQTLICIFCTLLVYLFIRDNSCTQWAPEQLKCNILLRHHKQNGANSNYGIEYRINEFSTQQSKPGRGVDIGVYTVYYRDMLSHTANNFLPS